MKLSAFTTAFTGRHDGSWNEVRVWDQDQKSWSYLYVDLAEDSILTLKQKFVIDALTKRIAKSAARLAKVPSESRTTRLTDMATRVAKILKQGRLLGGLHKSFLRSLRHRSLENGVPKSPWLNTPDPTSDSWLKYHFQWCDLTKQPVDVDKACSDLVAGKITIEEWNAMSVKQSLAFKRSGGTIV